MQTSRTVWLSYRDGQRIKPITDYLKLDYTRAVNTITSLTIEIPLTDKYIQLFADPTIWLDYRIEVWRRINNGAEYLDTDTVWFVRDIRKNLSKHTLVITAYAAIELLARRIIAYKAGTSNATKTNTIDNIMKAYVRENLGSLATNTARDLSTYLTVDSDYSQGVSITKAASFNNLLETLQDLSQQSRVQGTTPVPIFFDVIGVTTGGLAFRTFANQRNNDRTYGSQLYSVTLNENNLDNIEISYLFADEYNYVYSAGEGEESNRVVEEVPDNSRIGYSPFNRREVFTSYNSNITSVLDSQGYQKLREGKPKKIITADFRDTNKFAYGRDFQFGDLLSCAIDGETFTVLVSSVSVSVSANKETIKIAFSAELFASTTNTAIGGGG